MFARTPRPGPVLVSPSCSHSACPPASSARACPIARRTPSLAAPSSPSSRASSRIALAAVTQDMSDDLDDAACVQAVSDARRTAMSAEDERLAMQMAAKHATAGAGLGAAKEAPRPETPTTPVEKEKPRGVLPALLERRALWLLDPTRKTLVWGAPPVVSIPLLCSLFVVPSVPVVYASLVIALAHSFLTVELAASWCTLHALDADAENELDAWELDSGPSSPFISGEPPSSRLWEQSLARPGAGRLYHDCSTADLAFTAFLTVLAAHASTGSSALLAGMFVLACTSSSPSPRTTRTLSYHRGECDGAPPAERARGGRGVRARARALERSAEVWVRALRAPAWCTASASGSEGPFVQSSLPSCSPPAYLRLPPSRRYPYATSVYVSPPSLFPSSSLHYTYLRPPPTSTSLPFHVGTYRYQPVVCVYDE
ncbi:hypothetical protein FB451DRAFT_1470069 [Mycena latifolia]|nr:hypothetical protein FB451DRAFT_1470069 [Mycena latifolia]